MNILKDEQIASITGSVPIGSFYSAKPTEISFCLNSVKDLLEAQVRETLKMAGVWGVGLQSADEPQPDRSSRLPNKTVGECKHCKDPIYRFQVVSHEGCTREYEFNPDYLDFQQGAETERELGTARIEALKNRMRAIAAKFPTKSVDQIISLIEVNDEATSKGEEHNE